MIYIPFESRFSFGNILKWVEEPYRKFSVKKIVLTKKQTNNLPLVNYTKRDYPKRLLIFDILYFDEEFVDTPKTRSCSKAIGRTPYPQ